MSCTVVVFIYTLKCSSGWKNKTLSYPSWHLVNKELCILLCWTSYLKMSCVKYPVFWSQMSKTSNLQYFKFDPDTPRCINVIYLNMISGLWKPAKPHHLLSTLGCKLHEGVESTWNHIADTRHSLLPVHVLSPRPLSLEINYENYQEQKQKHDL